MYYYEIDFKDGFSMAIKSAVRITMKDKDDIEAWLRKGGDAEMADVGVARVIKSCLEDVKSGYNCDNIDNWPVYGSK